MQSTNFKEPLRGYQRAALLRQANALQPMAMVGKAGLTAAVTRHIAAEIGARELIKVRFLDFKDNRHELAAQVAAEIGAQVVTVVGHVALLYRPADDPTARRVVLPRRPLRDGAGRGGN